MTQPRPEWDDERLGAAFAARAEGASPTPADLAPSVMDRVGQRAIQRDGFVPWLMAAAGIAVVIALGAALGVQPSPRPLGSSATTPGGTQAGRPAPTSGAVAALGDPISVSTAIAVRDGGGTNDRELAVAGYLSPMRQLFCAFEPAAMNPTQLRCPQSFQWLMERPEILMTVGSDLSAVRSPNGPALHPSFALVDPPDVPIPPTGAVEPLSVVLIGHFHDRRAALCEPADVASCGATFLVDRVSAVNGQPRGVLTRLRSERFDDATQRQVTETPIDLEEDVDRLVYAVAPEAQIQSRLLVTIDQVLGIEPILKNDDVVPNFTQTALMWIVTAVDLRDGVPVARTFALIDGTNWIAEVTADGATQVIRHVVVGPSDGAEPIAPTADPTAFDAAPRTVLGMDVQGVAVVTQRRRLDGAVDRDEYAIRAWYVAPNPDAGCTPGDPAIHPPDPPCDAGRHWLLDRPDQLGVEPGQVRADPEQWPAVLNPILPVDVPFDVPDTWLAGSARPQPVIVLGHFNDVRLNAYHGDLYFVIDALAWTRDRSIPSIDSFVRLTNAATEDPQAVLGRIAQLGETDALATWTTVVDAAQFASLDPRTAADAPEFTSGAPVWIVRRLVRNETDGRQRLAVVSGWTADHGTRVWRTEEPDSAPDLATTLDLHDPDARTRVIRVFDYGNLVESVRSTAGLKLTWHRMEQHEAGFDVARGASDREVAIRWPSGGCDPDWQVLLRTVAGRPGAIDVEVRTYGESCPNDLVPRSILLEFDHPVALEALTTEYSPSGG
jgi:hypothetical protein